MAVAAAAYPLPTDPSRSRRNSQIEGPQYRIGLCRKEIRRRLRPLLHCFGPIVGPSPTGENPAGAVPLAVQKARAAAAC